MSDRNTRLAVSFSLVPIALALFLAFEAGRVPLFSLALFRSHIQVSVLLTTVLVVAMYLRIWRAYVLWTQKRVVLTLLIVSAMIGHALLWYPALTYGWPDLMCTAQALVLSGVCWAALTIVWWGVLPKPDLTRRKTMSPDGARFTSALCLVPLYTGSFILAETLCRSAWGSVRDTYACAFAICDLVMIAGWLALWRGRIVWTGRVVGGTVSLGLVTLASSVAAAESVMQTWRPLQYSAPFLALAIWFAGTAWLWRKRESPVVFAASNTEHVSCPQCSYNLKGLKEVHCPECGWTSTVDQIVKLAFENAAAD